VLSLDEGWETRDSASYRVPSDYQYRSSVQLDSPTL
jgi:hypothetical protein